MCFGGKIKSEINQILNICFNLLHLKCSKYKLENEILFLILPKYNSTRFNNSNIGTVNAIKKEIVYLEEMGEQIKSSLLIKTLLQKVYSYSVFICLQSSFLFQHGKKLWRHLSFFPTCLLLHENILITMRFARYHLPLASSSTFMTDSMYLGTIHGLTTSVTVFILPVFGQLLLRNGKILSKSLFWKERTWRADSRSQHESHFTSTLVNFSIIFSNWYYISSELLSVTKSSITYQ